MGFTVRTAYLTDLDHIINLAHTVQEAITSSGSKQVIGIPEYEIAAQIIRDENCFVIGDDQLQDRIVGVAFARILSDQYFHFVESQHQLSFEAESKPLTYLYSIVLAPEYQGHRIGTLFMQDIAKILSNSSSGTICLDCWEGSGKLRNFYERSGFVFHGIALEEDYKIAVYIRKTA